MNMNNITKYIQSLYQQELYSNVVKASELSLSVINQKPGSVSGLNILLLTYYYADSLFRIGKYQQAENMFYHCLQQKKNIMKNKSPNIKNDDKLNELLCDVEIKYKIYKCCLGLKKTNAAIEILQSINSRQKTAKINMALGNLLRDAGLDRQAVICYKEVLEECPFALEAVDNLLKLGVKGVEVNSLMVEVTNEITWLNMWLRAQAYLYSRDFSNAIQEYKIMETHGLLKNNVLLLINMGYCYHYMNETEQAINVLQKAIQLEPSQTFGLDLLSTLLSSIESLENINYMEKLVPSKIDTNLWGPEHWVLLGNYMYATKNYDKASSFGQQALNMSGNNIEALLLKANTLAQQSKYQEAANYCTEALQICPYRYDIHKCLVECYIKTNKLREAEAMALNTLKQLNYSPSALKLHATVLLKDPINSGKAIKKVLEKAIAHDKLGSTNSVVMLAVFLQQEQQYEQAKQLLLKQIEVQPSSRLHQLLGECYMNLQKDEEAFNHYNIALKLEPTNQRALEGLNSIGPSPLSKRDSYYTCVGESSYTSQATTASDREVDAESDTDLYSDMANV